MRLLTAIVSGVGEELTYVYATTELYPVPIFDELSVTATASNVIATDLEKFGDQFHISGISIGGVNEVVEVVVEHDAFDIGEFHISGLSIGGTNNVTSVVVNHAVFDIDSMHISGISIGGANVVTEVVVNHPAFDLDEFHISAISIGGTNTIT